MLFILVGVIGLAGLIVTIVLHIKSENASLKSVLVAALAACIFTICVFFAIAAPATMATKANGLPKEAMLIEAKLDDIDAMSQEEKAELFNRIAKYNVAVREGKINSQNIWFSLGYPREVFDNLGTFDNIDVIIKK